MNLVAIFGVVLNWVMLGLLNNCGEAGAGAAAGTGSAAGAGTGAAGQEKLLTQAQVDAIVQDRLAREKAKFADYDELKTFKTQHEKELEAATQKELEAKKEYEKLKEGFTKKEQELMGLVSKKDMEISDMKISSALINEITKQNAYAEESMALLKQQAVIDKEGNIRIKGRDANGIETMLTIEDGVKKFLEARPHLVKVIQKAGGGTGAAQAGGGAASGGDDLNSLNQQLATAIARGDHKASNELRIKVKAALAASGVRY
jgi:uncharacterized membrane protein YheB (UPF0754 family)